MVTRRDVFSAVFPSSSKASVPTPSSTPQIGSTPLGASFGSPEAVFLDSGDRASERIRWERAWHSATAFLSLRNAPISTTDAPDDAAAVRNKWVKSCSAEVSASILYLISERSRGRRLRLSSRDESLMAWYTQEIGRHYFQYQLPQLLEILGDESSSQLLTDLLQLLQTSQAVYFHPLKHHVLPKLPETTQYEFSKFHDGYDAMIALSFAKTSFSKHLGNFLERQGSVVLGLRVAEPLPDDNAMDIDQHSLIIEARKEVLAIMRCIDQVGLGGAQAQRIFAEVMSGLLKRHVNSTYAGRWASPSTIPKQLGDWVENQFARFAVEVLACLHKDKTTQTSQVSEITVTDLGNWKQRALCDLGALRLRELFEIVVDWDNDSRGAIEDLKRFTTTTAARAHLINSFSKVISRRLLQPGASTTEILQVYICIIRAFAVLDPKGVLLDRLARPIRRYLRNRDDTAKIIVDGLLADADDDPGTTDALIELAMELNRATEIAAGDDGDGELDWDDMNWMPDPVDAGPGYKKSKSQDVIGTLISLFDTKDIFVREFQNILGERLLNSGLNFDKETRVLELLKIRFGDAPLQACEVMLKDVLESRRTDGLVQKEPPLSSHQSQALHAKILSRLFWPSLAPSTFTVPPEIASLQSSYATAFETIKPTRRLTWLQALGLVTVELHLQDRTIVEDVTTWQASVIYAFQTPANDATSPSDPVTKTIAELSTDLAIEPALLQAALTFWVSKLVLRESRPETYTVLETLPITDLQTSAATGPMQATLAAAATAAAATSSAAAASTLQTGEDAAMQKMEEYWPYVVGMLTNQGAMPAQKIAMMLKFAVPGGFPFGAEEMKEFLRGKMEAGKVEIVGGSYRVVK